MDQRNNRYCIQYVLSWSTRVNVAIIAVAIELQARAVKGVPLAQFVGFSWEGASSAGQSWRQATPSHFCCYRSSVTLLKFKSTIGSLLRSFECAFEKYHLIIFPYSARLYEHKIQPLGLLRVP